MKILNRFAVTATVALAVAVTPIAFAQSTKDPSTMDGMKMGETAAPSEMTEGEVRKIDLEGGKVTLKHGDIKNLDMPGMTMLFRVSDPAMLDRVKPGDKVKFRAEKTGGAFVITELKVAP